MSKTDVVIEVMLNFLSPATAIGSTEYDESEDKRKRAKIVARYIYPLTEIAIDKLIPSFLEGIASACEIIRDSFANAAESFKCTAENLKGKGRKK